MTEQQRRTLKTKRADEFVERLMRADGEEPATLSGAPGFAMIDEHGREVDSRAYAWKLWKELVG